MSKNKNEDLLSEDDGQHYIEILHELLIDAESIVLSNDRYSNAVNLSVLDRIKHHVAYREQRVYTLHAESPNDHLVAEWKHQLTLHPTFKAEVKEIAAQRVKNIYRELREDKLTIGEKQTVGPYSYEDSTRYEQVSALKDQSQEIRKKLFQISEALNSIKSEDNNETEKDLFAHLYSEEKKKEVEAFIRKKKQEKEERRKKLQEQRQKDDQQLRELERQIEQKDEKQAKMLKEEFLKKQMELRERRKKQNEVREIRNSEYIKLKKELAAKPRLFEKLTKSYSQRKQYEELENRHRMMSEKKQRYLKIDQMHISQHQKYYEQLKQRKAEEREKKMQLLEERPIVRHHSSFQMQRKVDKAELERELAKEKYNKIKQYENVVREKFQPKIDEMKRKEMLTLIEELELNNRKKLKKTQLENGDVVYEQIKEADPRAIGIMYLEHTKEMALKARKMRGSGSIAQKQHQEQETRGKSIDYLEEMRKKPRSKPPKLSFIGKSNMSYDDKLKKVISESEKLNELTKQNQMKLKFGSFKTSDEILTCKQEIDQNYIDIARMKLKMIKEDQ